MPIELTLRAINAALGFVLLVLLLNAGGLLREYSLLLPMSLFVSLALDAGRTELALKYGLRNSEAATVVRHLGLSVVVSTLVVLLAMKLQVSQFWICVTAAAMSGISQVYVDIALRHSLFRLRSILLVSWFQFACATANVIVALAGQQQFVSQGTALVALVIVPALLALAARRHLLHHLEPDEPIGDAGTSGRRSKRLRGEAIGYRAGPSIGYSVYLFALRATAPSFEATARVLYFVFGFMHIRAMARRDRRLDWKWRGALMATVALVTSIPVLYLDSRSSGNFRIGDTVWASALLTVASLAGAKFLASYGSFLERG
jgi:hypothetical protein